MGLVTCQISLSLDGFVAGPNQSLQNPLGAGGERLHEWAFPTEGWRSMQGMEGGERGQDSDVVIESMSGNGAYIMGRNMFGGGPGPWDNSWTGWWGDEPPYRVPVFVLTHHPREPVAMLGGTTFTFVTDGVESALAQARAAAGDKKVSIAGGASAVAQFLRAGLLDELYLHLVPVILSSGERLLEDVGERTFELLKVVDSPTVTHLKYRVVH